MVIEVPSSNMTAELLAPAGRFSSSYRAEIKAIETALEWVAANNNAVPPGKVVIGTDSKSAVQKLRSGPGKQTDAAGKRIWTILTSGALQRYEVHFQWLPSHCGIPGNEAVDDTAKRASQLDQNNTEIDITTAKAVILRETRRRWLDKLAGSGRQFCGRTNFDDERGLSRRVRRILAQLRSGKCPILGEYRHEIKLVATPACERCSDPLDNLDHLLNRCPSLNSARKKHLSIMDDNARLLEEAPRRVARFLEESGALRRRI